jgi:hypothetical protein
MNEEKQAVKTNPTMIKKQSFLLPPAPCLLPSKS